MDMEKLLIDISKKLDILINYFATGMSNVNIIASKKLGEWLMDWMSIYKQKIQGERTYKNNLSIIEKYITPIFDYDMSTVTALELQNFINSIEKGRTRMAVYTILKDAFNKAHKLEIISKNVFVNVELERYEKIERRALTEREQNRFIKAIRGSKYEIHFLIYLTTGIRKMEICNLEFDFKKKLFFVKGTKTKTSIRYVPMCESVIKPLKNFLSTGKSLSTNASNLGKRFNDIMSKLKIQGVTLHSLRHTFATRCLENGIDMKTVQSWLGHSTYEMTANTYTHVQKPFLEKQGEKLNKVFTAL